MANNYKINLNPKEPSSEEIARHQDFAALLKQFEEDKKGVVAMPSQKTKRSARVLPLKTRNLYYIGSAVAAAVLLLLVFIPAIQQNKSIDPASYFAQRPYVDPPVINNDIEIDTKVFTVAVNQGGVYEYDKGSRLIVPAAAFANDYGQLIGGEVQIHYRELHDHVDFFVGGIPMSYDSTTIEYLLESGGMIEIYAEQNGERVQLADGKSIEVELVSDMLLPDPSILSNYSVYRLNQEARNWSYQKVDLKTTVAPYAPSSEDLVNNWRQRQERLEEDYKKEIRRLESSISLPQEPEKPEQRAVDRPTISLDFMQGNIELAEGSDISPAELEQLHEGAIWEISPNSPDVDSRAFNVVWEQVRLVRAAGRDYQLTLINPQKEESLLIRPALSGAAYRRALEQYEVDLRAYEAAVAERDELQAARRKAIEADFSQWRKKLESEIAEEITALSPADQRRLALRRVTHRFTANNFGIWQVAKPSLPQLTETKARFIDENGEEINEQVVYLADDNRNTVYRYLAGDGISLAYDPSATHIMWSLDEDGQIKVLGPADFQEMNTEDGLREYILKTVAPPVASETDLRETLSFD